LIFSKLYHVDIEPAKKIDNSYTQFNSFDDPIPLTEPIKLYYQELLVEAEKNDDPINPVRRKKPLTVDGHKCPRCGAPKKYLGSFGHDYAYIFKISTFF